MFILSPLLRARGTCQGRWAVVTLSWSTAGGIQAGTQTPPSLPKQSKSFEFGQTRGGTAIRVLPDRLCPGPVPSPACPRWCAVCVSGPKLVQGREMFIPGQVGGRVETSSLALHCGYSFSISKAIKGPKESTPIGFFFVVVVWDFLKIFIYFTESCMKTGGGKG